MICNFLKLITKHENAVLCNCKICNILPSDCQIIKTEERIENIVTWQPCERTTSPGDLMERQSEWKKPGFELNLCQ